MGVSAGPWVSFLLTAKLEKTREGESLPMKDAAENQAALAGDWPEETNHAHSLQCLMNSAFPSSQEWIFFF